MTGNYIKRKTFYQIQAFSSRWKIWDAEYVSQDTAATDFPTKEEAEREVEELIKHGGRERELLRIREVFIS